MSSKKSTKKQQVTDNKNKASIERASGLKVEQALGSITKASLDIQQTLSGLSAGIIEKVADLSAVDQAITLKKQELEALHGVDKILLSIDELNAEHRSVLEQLSKEQDQIRAENEELIAKFQEDRARQQAQFDYDLAQARKQDNDAYLEEVRIQKRDEQIRRENFEKSFAERELALKMKETAYNDALAKNATFEAEVEARTKAEVAKASAILRRDFEHIQQLASVQHRAEVDRLTTTNETTTRQLAAAQLTITDLQAQLKTAQEAQTQLAKDAVAAAANQKNLADMQSLMTNIGGNGQRPRS